MASKPPMLICISPCGDNDKECCLEDHEGRKFKTIVPHSAARDFVGLTCGYLVLFRRKTRDFWLVNPITRHELHFPPAPTIGCGEPVLVFLPPISKYVFVMRDTFKNHIWYSIAGEGAWNVVSTNHCFHNLHVFKKKIYAICYVVNSWKVRHLCELTLNPEPILTLLQTKNSMNEDLYLAELVSSGENLYFLKRLLVGGLYKVYKLHFGKMEWVHVEGTRDEHEHEFFLSDLKYGAAIKTESWADPQSQHGRFSRHDMFFTANQWYFPHECLNLNLLDES